MQRGGGFRGTKLTLALGFLLLEGPPRGLLGPSPPQHGAAPQVSSREMGWGGGQTPALSPARPGLLGAPARSPASALSGWPGLRCKSQVPGWGRLLTLRPGGDPLLPAWSRTLHTTPMVLKPRPRPPGGSGGSLTCTVLLYQDKRLSPPLYHTPLNGVNFLIIYIKINIYKYI